MAAARRSGFQPDRVISPKRAAHPVRPAPLPMANRKAQADLKEARTAFRQGNYEQALKRVRQLIEKPKPRLESTQSTKEEENADVSETQQFLSLSYFALGKYDEASTASTVGMSRGENWSWATLSGHYSNTSDYSQQLRALENSIRENSTPEKRFLVAYHYWMQGNSKAAKAQFERVATAKPQDELVKRILKELSNENVEQ